MSRAARLLLLTVLLVAAPLAAQDRRPMTTDDGLDMVRVGDALLSPDGAWVFYSLSELDWEENERDETYWMVPAAGGEPFPFIGEEGGSSFRFSPQGTYLSFTRSVDDTRQLFLMRTAGGEAVQLTDHEESVGRYVWAEDESRIFFVADDPRDDALEEEIEKGADAIFVDEGPNGQRADRWNDLWRVDVALSSEPVEPTRVTEDEHLVGSFDVSPDGRRIVYTRRIENRRNQGNLSEIHLVEVETGEDRTLTDNRTPEGGPQWAPDGRRIAFTASDDEEWELRNDKLWVMDVESGSLRQLSGAFEGNIRGWWWSPQGDAIVFNGLQRTDSNLYRLDVSSGTVERLTDVTGTLAASDLSADHGRVVYTLEDFDTPPDLWTAALDGSDAVRLTRANPELEEAIAFGDGDVVRWESADGTEIEGLLMTPDGWDGESRLPLLLHIHGGPAGVFTNSFSPRYHVWSGLGYAQLMPNVRGSSGYSDELLRGNMYDIGGGDYEDLMTGVDHVIDEGIADEDRLAVRGWSYGGILGGWTITQTDRFKAASLGAMVSDWTSEYGPGFNFDVSLWYIGGTPWENPDKWREMSPLTHASDVRTPTLLLHGMEDRTDTEPQSMMFYAALKDQGKTVRYIRFPREPHGFREPRHQRIRDIEEIRWIQEHTLGIDWEPWERPGEDAEEEKATAAVSP